MRFIILYFLIYVRRCSDLHDFVSEIEAVSLLGCFESVCIADEEHGVVDGGSDDGGSLDGLGRQSSRVCDK